MIYPYEMTMDIGYSRKLSHSLSAGFVMRYIHSDLSSASQVAGSDVEIGRSIAFDLGVYYKKEIEFLPIPSMLAYGINISNIGTPISYHEGSDKYPIPANLRIGSAFELRPSPKNAFTISMDINKLLVASNKIYDQGVIVRGMPEAENYFMCLIQSFYDAPGISYDDGTYSTVFRAELVEIILNFGLEYTFADKYSLRAGYFHESELSGARQYLSIGGGMKYSSWLMSLSFFPIRRENQSPLRNSLFITLSKSFS